MAKKKVKSAPPVEPTITRKQYLRRHKDDRQRRALVGVLSTILAGILVFLGFGIYQTWQQARTPVAKIEGEIVTATQFQSRLAYQRWQMLRNMASIQQMAQTTDPSFLRSLFDQQRANLAQTTVDGLIDETLIRQEAERRGVKVTDEDAKARVSQELKPMYSGSDESEATATGAVTGTVAAEASGIVTTTAGSAVAASGAITTAGGAEVAASGRVTTSAGAAVTTAGEVTVTTGVTGTSGVAVATGVTTTTGVTDTAAVTDTLAATATAQTARPTLESREFEVAFRDFLQPMLTQTGMSKGDYYDIVRQQLYRERLTLALGAEASITDKQVEAEYLLFPDEATAKEAADALAGGSTWDQVRQRFYRPSTPTPSATEPADTTETDAATGEATAEPSAAEGEGEAGSADAGETGADQLGSSEALTGTTGLTKTAGTTGTIGADLGADLGANASITPTATLTPTPAPTATPNPYANEAGERRWYTLDAFKQRTSASDDDAAKVLALAKGKTSEPISGTGGYYVVLVRDVDAERDLEGTEMTDRRNGALDTWLTDIRNKAKIDRYSFEDKVTPEPDWFIETYTQYAGAPDQPTVDLSSIIQATAVMATAEPGAATLQPFAITAQPAP